MVGEKATKSNMEATAAGGEGQAEALPPTFELRPDKPGHIRLLMAAIPALPAAERPAAEGILRQFELWEEAHRGTVN